MENTARPRLITQEIIGRYRVHLREQEKSASTIEQYARSLALLRSFLAGAVLTKSALIAWKEELAERYAPSSVNAMIAAANSLLDFCGWKDMKVRPLKIQRCLFCEAGRELTREEYVRLVRAADSEGNQRLSLVLQTICATGIRVSELRYITLEAVRVGKAVISNKGKRRTIILPAKLCRSLRLYMSAQKRTAGTVFVTKTGKPLDRSNLWRDMKALCRSAGVEPGKVFPHNLRHLFARTFYSMEKDLSRLADILGHSNVNTTRVYTVESGSIHARLLERMNLILT